MNAVGTKDINEDGRLSRHDSVDALGLRVPGQFSRRTLLRGAAVAAMGGILAPSLVACGSGEDAADGPLTLWWTAGLYPAEDEAIKNVVAGWEQSSGQKVDLQFYPQDAIAQKLQSAVTAGSPPDAAYAVAGHFLKYAYDGLLAEVGSVVDNAGLIDASRASANLFNAKTGSTGAYVVPVALALDFMFSWSNMIENAGLSITDIPAGWAEYWEFTKEIAGKATTPDQTVYPVGWSFGPKSGDTNNMFYCALLANGVQLLDANGQLQLDSESVRTGIGDSLEFVSGLYTNAMTPPDSLTWDGGGNNQAFLGRVVYSTPNGTLSIPGSVKEKDPETWSQILTRGYPDRVDGSDFPTTAATFSAGIFASSPRQDAARELFTHFLAPDAYQAWLSGGQARWAPSVAEVLDLDYWSKSSDPNIQIQTEMLKGDVVIGAYDLNGPYQTACNSGLWADTLGSIVVKGVSIDEATNAAIERMRKAEEDFGSTS